MTPKVAQNLNAAIKKVIMEMAKREKLLHSKEVFTLS